ncbi:hypothetical protein Tco_1458969 [Tanacetum coccineum]
MEKLSSLLARLDIESSRELLFRLTLVAQLFLEQGSRLVQDFSFSEWFGLLDLSIRHGFKTAVYSEYGLLLGVWAALTAIFAAESSRS